MRYIYVCTYIYLYARSEDRGQGQRNKLCLGGVLCPCESLHSKGWNKIYRKVTPITINSIHAYRMVCKCMFQSCTLTSPMTRRLITPGITTKMRTATFTRTRKVSILFYCIRVKRLASTCKRTLNPSNTTSTTTYYRTQGRGQFALE